MTETEWQTDWTMVGWLLLLALLLSLAISLIVQPVSAAEIEENITEEITENVTVVPTPTPTPTAKPTPLTTPGDGPIPYYVQQGETVYVGETVDISGIVGWPDDKGEFYFVWCYGGYGCYGAEEPSYKLHLPSKSRTGTVASQYKFLIDPAIFGERLGIWEQWDGDYERAGNTVAMNVETPKKRVNQSANASVVTPGRNQSAATLHQSLLPIQRVSDYLIAKGNGFSMKTNGTTSVWIFGAREALFDYRSFKGQVDISAAAINTLSPGSYKILIATRENGTIGESPIRYNNATGELQWFDTKTFKIMSYRVIDQTPENVFEKLKSIFPNTMDRYTLMNLEVQEPSLSIDRIDSVNNLNTSGLDLAWDVNGVSLNTPSYLDVRGYTNVAPGTQIYVKVDPDLANHNTMWNGAIKVKAEGEYGGNMREFKVIIPLDLYDMPSCGTGRCQHLIGAKVDIGNAYVTAPFYIYDSPDNSFAPNKTWRYASGKYGLEEIMPTPTPIVVTHVVTQVVTQTILVPVTPSNEQVYTQQKKAHDDLINEKLRLAASLIGSGLFMVGCTWYGLSVVRRAKE